MKRSAAATYIRQLCALGLGGPLMMPELVRALHHVIPSHINVFLYADRDGEFADIYSEYPDFLPLTKIFLEHFVQGSDRIPSFSECMRSHHGVAANEGVFNGNEFFRTDYYNLIFRPQGIHIPLQAAIRDRNGRALGAMLEYREPGSRDFTEEEMGLMASFIPHIAHGLQPRPDLSEAAAESEDRGLLVVQPPASVLYASPHIRTLIHFALNRTAGRNGDAGVDEALRPILTQLCANLRDAFTNRAAPPPAASLRSAWGQFILRAYWLESPGAAVSGLVGITIERHEPLSVHILRNMRDSGLTGRQRDLCLLLFEGMSIKAAARRLRVSQHTVVDHLKKIYLKLDVHSRDELRSKLESGPPEQAPRAG